MFAPLIDNDVKKRFYFNESYTFYFKKYINRNYCTKIKIYSYQGIL